MPLTICPNSTHSAAPTHPHATPSCLSSPPCSSFRTNECHTYTARVWCFTLPTVAAPTISASDVEADDIEVEDVSITPIPSSQCSL